MALIAGQLIIAFLAIQAVIAGITPERIVAGTAPDEIGTPTAADVVIATASEEMGKTRDKDLAKASYAYQLFFGVELRYISKENKFRVRIFVN